MRSRSLLVWAVLGAASIAGCRRSAPNGSHLSLSTIEPLRAAFNRDSGKVRAIFLASPT